MAPPPSTRYKQACACLPLCGNLRAVVPDQLAPAEGVSLGTTAINPVSVERTPEMLDEVRSRVQTVGEQVAELRGHL